MPVLSNAALTGSLDSVGGFVGQAIGGAFGASIASGRQNVADMNKYSSRPNQPTISPYPAAAADWRVRISLAPNADYFYNDPYSSLLTPLTNEPMQQISSQGAPALIARTLRPGADRIGVVFPYTPTVAVTHVANYAPQKLTHNNYTSYFYENSEVNPITINAEFTVQSIDEGQYLLATIYFFRALTKMFFGQDPQAGNPPPIVYLNGYGQYYMPNVPCVVTSFGHTMPADCDYMDIPEPYVSNQVAANRRLNSTRMPTTSTVTLTVQPVYSRTSQSGNFSLNDFARGALVNTRNASSAATLFGASQATHYGKSGNGGFL